jgi:hypothetical protein
MKQQTHKSKSPIDSIPTTITHKDSDTKKSDSPNRSSQSHLEDKNVSISSTSIDNSNNNSNSIDATENDENMNKKRKSKFEDEGDYMSMSFITEKEREKERQRQAKLKRTQQLLQENADNAAKNAVSSTNVMDSNISVVSAESTNPVSSDSTKTPAMIAASLAANWTQQQISARNAKYAAYRKEEEIDSAIHDSRITVSESEIKITNNEEDNSNSNMGFVLVETKEETPPPPPPPQTVINEPANATNDESKHISTGTSEVITQQQSEVAATNNAAPVAPVPLDPRSATAIQLEAQAKAYAEYQKNYYQWYYQQQQYYAQAYQQQYYSQMAAVAYKDPRTTDPAMRRFYGLEDDKDDA